MVRFWTEPTVKDAFILSIVSLVVTFIAALVGISLFLKNNSSLCLVYGLENCVDFASSLVVLWRFYAPHYHTGTANADIDHELENKLKNREKRASTAISFVLVLLGFMVLIAAIGDAAKGAEGERDSLKSIVVISFLSLISFSALAAFKLRFATCLESASLYKDGLCSLIGTILAAALFVNTLMIESIPSVWWTDPVIAMFCGGASMYLGFTGIYRAAIVDGLPIFTLSWWQHSGGDGTDEFSGRPLGPEDFPSGTNSNNTTDKKNSSNANTADPAEADNELV